MRSRFDGELQQLNNVLIMMGAACEEAIACSVKAALDADETEDGELRARAAELEEKIDRQERDAEDLCLRLLLLQQPVAGDLRVISSALKMISDMERIGDQALDIAELAGRIRGVDDGRRLHLRQMATETIKMVTDSVNAFVNTDLQAARAVIAYDDVVDGLFNAVRRELTELVSGDSANGEMYLDTLMAAKYFERIGDHAANIAEWVEFSITGKHDENA